MDLPSVLGGLAQGFKDFGTSVVDLFGTGGAAIGDLLQGTGTRNQDDFRKWLYNTNSVQDAAAKGLGTALNGVQTVSDYIPGIGAVTRNPLFNAAQGALGGLADEFKMNGENYDLGRAGQRAAVSGAAALAGSSLGDALKKSANPILQSGLAQGLARGAAGGAINQGGYAAIDGGDIMQSALQGAGMGALLGGATGAIQDFMPRKQAYMPLTEEEKTARIANAKQMLETATTPERRAELQAQISRLGGTVENGPAPGNKRLYRGLTQEYDPNYPTNKLDTSGYESWTDNPELARQYGENVYYTDVPESDIKTSYMDENPQSETYGDRNLWHSITKPAGLNGVSGTEYLLYMDDPASRSLTRSRLPGGGTLDATLADADMAVNNPKLTPEQEAYFKDSVIRDENGNLMPMYHGSRSKFTVFDNSKGGESNKMARVGHWFTPNEQGARRFADQTWYGDLDEPEVYSTYLNIKKPKIYEPIDNSEQINSLQNSIGDLRNKLEHMRRGTDEFNEMYKQYNDLSKQLADLSYGDPYEQFRSDVYAMEGKSPEQANVGGIGMIMDDEKAATQKYVQSLRDQGYDGIIIKGTGYDGGTLGGSNDQYVVFDSNQIKDINNLKPTSDVDIMASRMTPDEMDLARALAGQDMAVNSAKVAPGQLGLFDDLPTQTPKTGTRQTSLFDQPQEGLDYYGGDIEAPTIESTNPYAPVDGKFTKAMERRYDEIMEKARSFDNVVDNELYNKIDKSTLPKGYDKLRQYLDGRMSPDTDMVSKELVKGIGTDMPLQANTDKLLDYVYGDDHNAKVTFNRDLDEHIRLNRKNGPALGIDADQAEQDARKAAHQRLVSEAMDKAKRTVIDEIVGESDSDDILFALQNSQSKGIRGGDVAALDTILSERLGIAPGNTVKIDRAGADEGIKKNTLGRYSRNARDIAINDRNSREGKVSTVAHERLHSFQNEAKPESAGRYSAEVAEAYKELQKDLGHYYKSNSEIKKRYKSDVDYWARSGEQESRMFQQYLENKGYTNDGPMRKLMGREGEWGNEINPAFDKFIDKLRDLSKRGVALPALAGLFGGSVVLDQVLNSKDSDKDKKKTKRSA